MPFVPRREVVLHGESYSDAETEAHRLMAEQGLEFVHPFDDPDVIAGQGTIAMELLRQHPGPIDAVFVAIGGGGLISGIATYLKSLRPDIRIIGVQTEDSDAMARSVGAGEIIELDDVGLFSDGTAVRRVGDETFRLVQRHVDEILRVDTDAVCGDQGCVRRHPGHPRARWSARHRRPEALRRADGCKGQTFDRDRMRANMNFDRLRFVSERAEIGERREAVLP